MLQCNAVVQHRVLQGGVVTAAVKHLISNNIITEEHPTLSYTRCTAVLQWGTLQFVASCRNFSDVFTVQLWVTLVSDRSKTRAKMRSWGFDSDHGTAVGTLATHRCTNEDFGLDEDGNYITETAKSTLTEDEKDPAG